MASDSSRNIFLTIIFPAFNKEDRLPASLLETVEFLRARDYTWEIIVVDDGSTAGTVTAAAKILKQTHSPGKIIALKKNRSKGAAVNAGLRAANGRYVFFSDADLSTPIEELERMLSLFDGGCDIVIGSRAQSDSQLVVHQPFFREFAGRIFNVFVQSIVFPCIKDIQCGFKGFRREAIPFLIDNQKTMALLLMWSCSGWPKNTAWTRRWFPCAGFPYRNEHTGVLALYRIKPLAPEATQ